MVRIEGFIDLDKELKKVGINTKNMRTIRESKLVQYMHGTDESGIFKINYNNVIYYFKYNKEVLPYNELVANELVSDFGLPTVEYDLAILGKEKGVISRSFERDNFSYISGQKLLSSIDIKDGFYDPYSNDLESIWYALEYRYRNHSNKTEIVEKLMYRIVSLFIFDILLHQYDRHSHNWQIEEGPDYIDIAPIYDNEYKFSRKINVVHLTIDDNGNNLNENLESFMKVSGSEFVDLVKEKMWIISDGNLEKVFERIGDKTGYPMPEDIKKYYLKEFGLHRNELEKIIYKKETISRK